MSQQIPFLSVPNFKDKTDMENYLRSMSQKFNLLLSYFNQYYLNRKVAESDDADTTDLHHLDQDVLIASSPTFVKATLSQATGTAPLTISSTTKVSNLNAEQVDGLDLVTSNLVKGWVKYNGVTDTVLGSFNATMVTVGVGIYVVTWTTPFSSANYCCIATCGDSAANPRFASVTKSDFVAGSVQIRTFDNNGSLQDCDVVCVLALGV